MKRTAVALTGGLALAVTAAVPALADSHESSVSVLHGVPGLTVDVYVNGEEAIPDFAPGTLTDPLTLAAGSYDVAVYPDGSDPEADEPAISAEGLEVPGGANLTLVAHLAADGTPTLAAFANDTSQLEAGESRLTVRHTAAAPAVDVRAGGEAVIQALENPNEQVLELPAGTVSADVVAAGTDTVVLGPADLALAEGTNTIVYAWGSLDDDTLDLAVQTIDGLHGDPGGVPGGEAGLMGSGSTVLWVLAAAGAAGVALASRRLATHQ
ncbi:DUF4397 domain-containing protein [Ornithinimicrobium pratense]|uniref:DUF4397 domain-containing protein n=1 Tax=Ornithinimicrobium pratense TaxID=2593973 RepID=A0A5J6V147_9MICO|nr:DUF4397 domain-containing protein [Ornithinimicrobium pratense]QFG67400.1 DUF4397 domain-containing protein [Ornithinimicrobium pratense]